MTDSGFQVPILFDYIATFTWAVSGAIVAIRRRFDITGVFIVALLAAIGGGLLRDALFLNRTPVFLVDPAYLTLIFAATMATAIFTRYLRKLIGPDTVQKIVDYIDALGTPAFAVFGMQLARNAGMPLIAVVFVGVANGVAGGLLRDVVVRDVPALLRPGQFASLILLAACGVYLLLSDQFGLGPLRAGWITVGTFFVVRVLTIRFNWQTGPVWEGDETPHP
ncbi:MAG TPA: TRIC cation channel family protein [Steroidobacteraceae bacterium]|nr:TRIC cation channel family protein [Steroidobacteraceae bacterium]